MKLTAFSVFVVLATLTFACKQKVSLACVLDYLNRMFRRLCPIFIIKRGKSDCVTVNTHQGKLRGKKVLSQNGSVYYGFHGIPYAKPPVGKLRFKAPEAPDAWKGIRDAFVDGSDAPQICYFRNHYIGSEDCLFLNVYTSQTTTSTPKPVMVWIHGGGFVFGSGSLEFYGPEFLMEHDVILVTINYRLGILGFLSLDGTNTTANNGLRDQVAALKWVKKNISEFGGDPDNVTIFGESAGGVSVHYHILSNLSKGLFHRGIIMSGSALNPWAFVDRNIIEQRAFRLGEILECKTNSAAQLKHFLLNAPAELLIENQDKTLTQEDKQQIVKFPFVPCNESDAEEAFLPGNPFELMTCGKFNNVPVMTGVTSEEGKLILEPGLSCNIPPLENLTSNLGSILPSDWCKGCSVSSEILEDVLNKIQCIYFKNDLPLLHAFVTLQSDIQFNLGILKNIDLLMLHSQSPVFLYQFSFEGSFTFLNFLGIKTDVPGVSHADELFYLFKSSVCQNELKHGSEEYKVSRVMTKLFTNFAKTGNPTDNMDMSWPPLNKDSSQYLTIDKNLTIGSDLYKERYNFWRENVFNKIGFV